MSGYKKISVNFPMLSYDLTYGMTHSKNHTLVNQLCCIRRPRFKIEIHKETLIGENGNVEYCKVLNIHNGEHHGGIFLNKTEEGYKVYELIGSQYQQSQIIKEDNVFPMLQGVDAELFCFSKMGFVESGKEYSCINIFPNEISLSSQTKVVFDREEEAFEATVFYKTLSKSNISKVSVSEFDGGQYMFFSPVGVKLKVENSDQKPEFLSIEPDISHIKKNNFNLKSQSYEISSLPEQSMILTDHKVKDVSNQYLLLDVVVFKNILLSPLRMAFVEECKKKQVKGGYFENAQVTTRYSFEKDILNHSVSTLLVSKIISDFIGTRNTYVLVMPGSELFFFDLLKNLENVAGVSFLTPALSKSDFFNLKRTYEDNFNGYEVKAESVQGLMQSLSVPWTVGHRKEQILFNMPEDQFFKMPPQYVEMNLEINQSVLEYASESMYSEFLKVFSQAIK